MKRLMGVLGLIFVLTLCSVYTFFNAGHQKNGVYSLIYRLEVGDSIITSNGYTVQLQLAFGEMGTRSDWRTDIWIRDPDGNVVDEITTFERYWTKDTGHLIIKCERYVGGEAVITVTSPEAAVDY